MCMEIPKLFGDSWFLFLRDVFRHPHEADKEMLPDTPDDKNIENKNNDNNNYYYFNDNTHLMFLAGSLNPWNPSLTKPHHHFITNH